MANYLAEAFKAFDALEEDTFEVSDSGIEQLDGFLDDSSAFDKDTVEVFDLEAENEEDLKDSYVGEAILDCCVCHEKLFKNKEDIIIDEEAQVANVGEECPYCFSVDGFKVLGEVAPLTTEAEEKVEVGDDVKESLKEDLDRDSSYKDAKQLIKDIDKFLREIEKNGIREWYFTRDSIDALHKGRDAIVDFTEVYINETIESGKNESLKEGIFDSKKTKQKNYEEDIKNIFGSNANVIANEVANNVNRVIEEVVDTLGDESRSKNMAKKFITISKNAKITASKTPQALVKNIINIGTTNAPDAMGLDELKDFISKVGKLQTASKTGYKAMEYLMSMVNNKLVSLFDRTAKSLQNDFAIHESKSIKEDVEPDYTIEEDDVQFFDEETGNIQVYSDIMKYEPNRRITVRFIDDNGGSIQEYKMISLDDGLITLEWIGTEETVTESKSISEGSTNTNKHRVEVKYQEYKRYEEGKVKTVRASGSTLSEALLKIDKKLYWFAIQSIREDYPEFVDEDGNIEVEKVPADLILDLWEAEHIEDDGDDYIFYVKDLSNGSILLGDEDVVDLDEQLNEDTVKQDGKWVNRGKKGTHGTFKTKKAADAQRKAMFASGFREELKKKLIPESLGSDVDKFQEWVDYDMKRYGRISKQTEKEVKEAGLEIVKDKYGDYQVIAGRYNESLEEVSIKTNDSKTEVKTEDDSKIIVEVEPKEDCCKEEKEVIKPLSKEDEEKIEDNSEEIEEVDDISFDELEESFLKKVYSNIDSYKTASIKNKDGKFFVEGIIKFNSGKTKKASFIFESAGKTPRNKYKLIGESIQITPKKNAFRILGSKVGNKFVSESMNYDYRTKNLEESLRVNGRVARKLSE